MDYKKIIIEILDRLNVEQLKCVYSFIRGVVGLK